MPGNPDKDEDPGYAAFDAGLAAPTLLCPSGHPNAWNYKFCAQCGAAIGVASRPEAKTPANSEARSRRPWAAIGTTAAVVLTVAVVAVFVLYRGGEESQPRNGSTAFPTEGPTASLPASCDEPPMVKAESVDLSPDGLEVQAAFLSPCGADVEANSGLVVTVADGARDVAAASFDFSVQPLPMNRGVPARRTLVFPSGTYWRTPYLVTAAPTVNARRAGPSSESVPVSPSSGPFRIIASGPAKPANRGVEQVAASVLEEFRVADYSDVRMLSNAWVPQISSKRLGLIAVGKTWTNAEILREHLDLRQRFPAARLVWSGQWSTFSAPDFWVTVVGPAHAYPEGANQWCEDEDFGPDDCFAKFISTFFGPSGTTRYRG
jgi:hypothetical protein